MVLEPFEEVIKTRNSASQGQEEAGHIRLTSDLLILQVAPL